MTTLDVVFEDNPYQIETIEKIPEIEASLLQIATIVLSGLALYSLIFLPFFVPVMVKMFGEANWWPFMKNKRDQVQKENTLDH